MRSLKKCYFLLAALNTLATTWYANYLFFFLRDQFGFGNRQNLWVSALYGFIYISPAGQCGKFAQRRGFITSLKVGFAGLTLAMIFGALLTNSVAGNLCALVGYTIVLLFIWPALEALVSENETQAGVQHNVGVYNCTWALARGGRVFHRRKTLRLARARRGVLGAGGDLCAAVRDCDVAGEEKGSRIGGRGAEHLNPPRSRQISRTPRRRRFTSPCRRRRFLQMAWLANPFAYVAINTVIAVMPGIAQKLTLSPTRVGLFCSVWMFARLATFALMWQWRGWHYRFRWLLSAFLMLIGSFMVLLLANQLWLVVLAQVFFGFAVGLIYYSSLFYSMDVGGETQGEHGGLHEAAIGIGICVGPAVGAAALQWCPRTRRTAFSP